MPRSLWKSCQHRTIGLFGEATCPRSGPLLWFLNVGSEVRLLDRSKSNEVQFDPPMPDVLD